MPEFPRYSSDRQLTTQQPRALRDDADIRTDAADRSKIASDGISKLSDTTMKWNAAVENIQADTARHNFKLGMAEIANEAANDTDISAEGKYQKKIQDLRKGVTAGINNQSLVNRMGAELNYMGNMGSLGIQQEFRKKTIIHGQKVKMDELTFAAQNPHKDSIQEIKAIVTKGVEQGYFDEVQGQKLQTKYTAQMRQNAFIGDLNENPAEAEKALLQNKYGFDIAELDSAQKVFEREVKVIQNQTELDAMQMKLDGTLEEEWIREQIKIKKIQPQAGIAMIKDLNTIVQPKATALDKTTEFNSLVAMRDGLRRKESAWLGMGNADFEERTKYRAAVFNAHAKGLITDDEMSTDFLQEEVTQKFMNDPKFQNAMETVYSTSQQYQSREDKDIAKAQMSKALTRKVMNGMAPTEALKDTIYERVAADYPGVDPENLLYTAQKRGAKVWQIYKLLTDKGEQSAD